MFLWGHLLELWRQDGPSLASWLLSVLGVSDIGVDTGPLWVSVLWGGAHFRRSSQAGLVGVLSDAIAVSRVCPHQHSHAAAFTNSNSTIFGANPRVHSHSFYL